MMYPIEHERPSDAFVSCWEVACDHIAKQVQGPFNTWLKQNLHPPFREHLAFRLGNQAFYVRIEDVDGKLAVPASREGLMRIAEGCNGYPCLMPMRHRAAAWAPDAAGWGLLDARTGKPVDPIALVSDERIETTNWELHDFAVQVVRDRLTKTGKTIARWHGYPDVDPAIWVIGASGLEWIVVRAVRFPELDAAIPDNWHEIVRACAQFGKVGYFASVGLASANDAFDPSGEVPVEPLWRGHAIRVRFHGLMSVPPPGSSGGGLLTTLRGLLPRLGAPR